MWEVGFWGTVLLAMVAAAGGGVGDALWRTVSVYVWLVMLYSGEVGKCVGEDVVVVVDFKEGNSSRSSRLLRRPPPAPGTPHALRHA